MRIGLTYDLRADYLAAGYGEEETAEFDRPDTIEAVADALRTLGHEPDRIGNAWRLVERLARGDRWDLVFNIAEGLFGIGREAQVPALLDLYQIPYTFSDPLVMALSLAQRHGQGRGPRRRDPDPGFRRDGAAGRPRAGLPPLSAVCQAGGRRDGQGDRARLEDRRRGVPAPGLRGASGTVSAAGPFGGLSARPGDDRRHVGDRSQGRGAGNLGDCVEPGG